jgi:hypothetical protein
LWPQNASYSVGGGSSEATVERITSTAAASFVEICGVARSSQRGSEAIASCCGPADASGSCCSGEVAGFGPELYALTDRAGLPDAAVDGDARRSLSLATALVRVARLGAVAPTPPLATGLLADSQALSARVDRLLHPRAAKPRTPYPATTAVLVFGTLLAAVMLNPATLPAVHQLLERLINYDLW